MIIVSTMVFGYTNLDYSNPQDSWVDLIMSLNQTGNNFTVDNFEGNLSWSYLKDFPVACPTYSALTQLNDSVTCTSYELMSTLNVTGNVYINGSLMPITSLSFDIGSGPLRWGDLYVSDISADDITAVTYYGNGAELDNLNVSTVIYLNGTSVSDIFVDEVGDTMTGPLLNTDGTYTVTINGTTISSDTYYAPLLELGGGTVATGNNAIAAGMGASATGNYCVALGGLASCTGASSMALGDGATSGYRAIALGYQAVASGSYASALGWASLASNDYATAIGFQTTASGSASLAMGAYTTASGLSSVGIGRSSTASGNYSYALGDNVTVSGTNSYGFGRDGTSSDNEQFTLHNLDLNVSGNAILQELTVSGDVNITGRLYNDFPHMYGIASEIQSVASSGVWYNITFNITSSIVEGNISFEDNRTILINESGDYKVIYGISVQDSAPSPNADVAFRIAKNGVQLAGSYFQIKTRKQSSDQWIEHFTYADDLEIGDELNMQYISSATTVSVTSSQTYNTGLAKVAYGYIERTTE